MNIILVGYGKMGRAIEKVAQHRGHKIVNRIDCNNTHELNSLNSTEIDIAIEFTQPQSAANLIKQCLNQNIAVVSGTTAWNEDVHVFEDLKRISREKQVSFLHAPNFSLGVQLFFKFNRYLAQLMSNQKAYRVELCEIHHTEKLDAPSGTAVALANQILASNPNLDAWSLTKSPQSTAERVLPVQARRQEGVPGTHIITYKSNADQIILEHKAFNRAGFSEGVVMVAEWLQGKQGFFTIDDYLQETLSQLKTKK